MLRLTATTISCMSWHDSVVSESCGHRNEIDDGCGWTVSLLGYHRFTLKTRWFLIGFVLISILFLKTFMVLAAELESEKLTFPRQAPLTVKEALESFETQPGYEMSIVAAEPLVASPVCVEYDSWGNGWVLEMHDYPYTDPTTDKPFVEKTSDLPLGRIRVLRDTDSDGVFDDSRVFVDGISWPTGLAFWKNGVFVAATPDVWYFEDTNDDGQADIKERVATGFRKFNIQAVMNNLRWGIDHHIYAAGGTNGGSIQTLADPSAQPLKMGTNDFRIEPMTRKLELLSGGARFGHALDDYGNRFLCNIRNPVIHVVLPSDVIARNPFVPVRSSLFDCSEIGDSLPVFRSSPPEPWRAFRATRWTTDLEGKLYPKSELVPAGFFTSASGITLFRGDQWPESDPGIERLLQSASTSQEQTTRRSALDSGDGFVGQAILADVASNVIHRQWLEPDGVSFRAKRIDIETEFVRSRDTWFRPVNFTNAPDGSLHVVDMYRETIEHPWSIPDDIKSALDLRSGSDRGRLWRIAKMGFRPQPIVSPPAAADNRALADMLDSDNAWRRDTAARLLFERQDPSVVPQLRHILTTTAKARTAVRTLWALEGLDRLEASDVSWGLRHRAAVVREQAIILCFREIQRANAQIPSGQSSPILAAALQLASDPSPRVRFQLAMQLDQSVDDRIPTVLAELAIRSPHDEFLRAAILATATSQPAKLVSLLVSERYIQFACQQPQLLRGLAATVAGAGSADNIRAFVSDVSKLADKDKESKALAMEMIQGVVGVLKQQGKTVAQVMPALIPRVNELLADARSLAVDRSAAASTRAQAISLLAMGTFESVRDPLVEALAPDEPGIVQSAALKSLATFDAPELAELFVVQWKVATPTIRTEIIEALLGRPERIPHLLSAIESNQIGAIQLSPSRRGLLIRHSDPQIKSRARLLFGEGVSPARKGVVERYQASLGKTIENGDLTLGKKIFERECASCHRVGSLGVAVGPNLETVRHHTPAQLVNSILDPNREVTPTFMEYVIALKDGKTISGIIAAETATSLLLKRANAVEESVLREFILELSSTGVSLMPEGFENKINEADMGSLILFLRSSNPEKK